MPKMIDVCIGALCGLVTKANAIIATWTQPKGGLKMSETQDIEVTGKTARRSIRLSAIFLDAMEYLARNRIVSFHKPVIIDDELMRQMNEKIQDQKNDTSKGITGEEFYRSTIEAINSKVKSIRDSAKAAKTPVL